MSDKQLATDHWLEVTAVCLGLSFLGRRNLAQLRAAGIQSTWIERHYFINTFILWPIRYGLGFYLIGTIIGETIWKPGSPPGSGYNFGLVAVTILVTWLLNHWLNRYFVAKLYPARYAYNRYSARVRQLQRRQQAAQKASEETRWRAYASNQPWMRAEYLPRSAARAFQQPRPSSGSSSPADRR